MQIKHQSFSFCTRFLHIICCVLLSFYPAKSTSSSTTITDQNLLTCVEALGRKNAWAAPSEYLHITCHNKKIASATGLQEFVNITKLSLHKNNITSFDASRFTRLRVLNLGRNKLKQLKISQLTELAELYVFGNLLTVLDLSTLPKLTKIKANSNQLLNFRYHALPQLNKVYMFDNQMEHIDIHSLPRLKYMDVRQNPMPDKLYEKMDQLKGATILHDGNADDWN